MTRARVPSRGVPRNRGVSDSFFTSAITRGEAKKRKYCEYCAAFHNGRAHCGVLAVGQAKGLCLLDGVTRRRWKAEHGMVIPQERPPF